MFNGGDSFPFEFIKSIHDSYTTLEAFLETDPFLVGNELTLPDICTSISISCLSVVTNVDEARYPKINAWLERISEKIPFFDEMNEPHVEEYREVINARMESNKLKEETEE